MVRWLARSVWSGGRREVITFKIVDKKGAKRTAMQEQVIFPLRANVINELKVQ